MNMFLFAMWATLHYKSYPILGGLQWSRLKAFYCWNHSRHASLWQILYTLQNWRDQLPWNHLYHLSSISSPSIRRWDQLNGETLVGKSTHRKVKQIDHVGSDRIDQFNGWWYSCGHTEEARKSRNYNCKCTQQIHIWHLDLVYINWTDKQNAPNWQRRTFEQPNVTMTPGIDTTC